MASVLVRRNGALRLYNKGAAEMVLTRCTAIVNAAGETVPMTEVGGQWGRCWLWGRLVCSVWGPVAQPTLLWRHCVTFCWLTPASPPPRPPARRCARS